MLFILKKALKICLIIVLIIPVTGVGQAREEEEIKKGLSRVVELIDVLKANYYIKLESGELVDGSIRGMLGQLDPHSTFMLPDNAQQMGLQQQGEYSGVGLTVGLRNGKMTVVSPIENGPGAKQGVRSGDIITAIDGEVTSREHYNDNVRKLRGARGTEVVVTIERPGMQGTFDVTIVRDKISLSTVPYFFMLNNSTGYIRLTSFAQKSAKEMEEAIADLQRRGMNELIFDLRSNPGGDLDAAVSIADLFIDDGMIVYTKGLSEMPRDEFKASKDNTRFRGPVVVMINNASASGSEIVAAAIQDHDRGWLVGEKTWGKGLVQSVYPLQYGASLSLTTARYYTPSGRLIQRSYTPGSFDDYYNPDENDSQNHLDQAKTTHLNRPVYGGNGIAPDKEAKVDDITQLTQQILFRGTIFTFVTEFLGKYPKTDTTFRANNQVMNDFKSMVEKDDQIKFDEQQWQQDYQLIKDRITLEVITRLAGAEAGYRSVLKNDIQLQQALKEIKNAIDLLQRRLQTEG